MPAKIVNDNAALQRVRVAWVFFASKLAPMYGLAPTFNPLFKHCYPVASMYQAYSRKPKQLLANIGSARDMPITVRPQGPVGAQASVRDGLTRGQCS
ncbi:hypothetical protein FIV36_17090, partial [Pseudomonas extremaustralis]